MKWGDVGSSTVIKKVGLLLLLPNLSSFSIGSWLAKTADERPKNWHRGRGRRPAVLQVALARQT